VSDLSSHPDAGWWAGRRVTLVGFASRQTGLPPRSFIVARFLVSCCVVDATLMGFPVQLGRRELPSDGAWVQVSGVFGRQYWIDPSGQHYPLIGQARIAPVSIPSSPYLSP
jgi:putative membrane protein